MNNSQIELEIVSILLALKRAKLATDSNLGAFLRSSLAGGVAQEAIADQLFTTFGSAKAIAASLASVKATLVKSADLGVSAIPMTSSWYPESLRGIIDAPPVIFVKGNLEVLLRPPGVAVVGTRNASRHGLTIAARVSTHLGNAGFTVVSGLALGIDASAHEGALKSSSPTVAVLAHGLEKASPKVNALLAERILDANGLWVSEHIVGTPAKPEYFVFRNRIQVGLSCASVIVEGAERSGSATQADFCIRNHRLLFAVVPEVGASVSTQNELPMMLVQKRGAIPISSKEDYPSVVAAVLRRSGELQAKTGQFPDGTVTP